MTASSKCLAIENYTITVNRNHLLNQSHYILFLSHQLLSDFKVDVYAYQRDVMLDLDIKKYQKRKRRLIDILFFILVLIILNIIMYLILKS